MLEYEIKFCLDCGHHYCECGKDERLNLDHFDPNHDTRDLKDCPDCGTTVVEDCKQCPECEWIFDLEGCEDE